MITSCPNNSGRDSDLTVTLIFCFIFFIIVTFYLTLAKRRILAHVSQELNNVHLKIFLTKKKIQYIYFPDILMHFEHSW